MLPPLNKEVTQTFTLTESQKHFDLLENEINQILEPYDYKLEFVETTLYHGKNHASESFSEKPSVIYKDAYYLSNYYIIDIDNNQKIEIFLDNYRGTEATSIYYNFLYNESYDYDLDKHLKIIEDISRNISQIEISPTFIKSLRNRSLKNISEKPQSLFFDHFLADIYAKASDHSFDHSSHYFLLLSDDNVLEERIGVLSNTRFAYGESK